MFCSLHLKDTISVTFYQIENSMVILPSFYPQKLKIFNMVPHKMLLEVLFESSKINSALHSVNYSNPIKFAYALMSSYRVSKKKP